MTVGQTSHITMTYKDNGDEITCVYMIGRDTLRDAMIWSSQQHNPTGQDLQRWLQIKGCRLDCAEGPALSGMVPTARRSRAITAMADGTAKTARP